LLAEWVKIQLAAASLRPDLLAEAELREQSRQFLSIFREALMRGAPDDLSDTQWDDTRAFLSDVSRSRALKGFSPTETATFILSLKEPLFRRARIRSEEH